LGYQARTGVPVTIYHPVRDIDGNLVAGQAAAVTKALLGPDRAAAPDELADVTLVDHVVAGWVVVQFFGARLGTYTLSLTNPAIPDADGRTVDYDIAVAPGILATDLLLTSLDRVRACLKIKIGSPPHLILPGEAYEFDDLINLLISEVSDDYQELTGRTFAETQYTEYFDGSGGRSLVLGAGPLVSVTSLESVEYGDDGAGGVDETRTVVAPHTYVLAGLRSQPRYTGRGRLDLVDGLFWRGARNYRAVYTAGFDTIPEKVVGLATAEVVSRLFSSTTGPLLSQSLGDGSVTYMRPGQMEEFREMSLAGYRLEAA
jgi:hypothetical protein